MILRVRGFDDSPVLCEQLEVGGAQESWVRQWSGSVRVSGGWLLLRGREWAASEGRVGLQAVAAGFALVAFGCAVRPFVVQQVEPLNGGVVAAVEDATAGIDALPLQQVEAAIESPIESPIEQISSSGDGVLAIVDGVSAIVDGVSAIVEDAVATLQRNFLEYTHLNYEPGLAGQVAVLFDFNSSEISDQGWRFLDVQVKWLLAHPQARIVLEGHTDNTGAAWYNVRLGEQRAASVRDYMIGEGVATERITIESRGEDDPFLEDRADAPENRRVVTRIVEGSSDSSSEILGGIAAP